MKSYRNREITWDVVWDLARDLEAEYAMDVTIEVKPAEPTAFQPAFWVMPSAEPRTLTAQCHRPGSKVCVRYPGARFRTLEGAAFRALWDLERRLGEQRDAELAARTERQAKLL